MHLWPVPCLMLITDRHRLQGRSLEEVVSLAVEGGANVVQLREKDLSGGQLYDLAIALKDTIGDGALLLVNDRIDVALAAGVEGVHLPEHSLPGSAVWEMTGDGCIVGRSVHSVEAAEEAEADGADFVQAGTIFETASKPGIAAAGVELLRDVASAVRMPVVAVGGVTEANVAAAVEAGADGVAVIGAIMDADDPKSAAFGLRRALDDATDT